MISGNWVETSSLGSRQKWDTSSKPVDNCLLGEVTWKNGNATYVAVDNGK